MCYLNRCFYPIGQGSFYSEMHRIDNNNSVFIIYDCGSDNVSDLEREIRHIPSTIIDFLIVSHYHEDHINGIKRLINNGVSIKTLIVPKITNTEKCIYVAENADYNMLFDTQNYFSASRMIEVDDSDEISQENSFLQTGNIVLGHKNRNTIHDNYPWMLKFFVDKAIYSGLTIQDVKYLDQISIKDFSNRETIKSIRVIYKKLDSKINKTSICMYSGPNPKNKEWQYHHHFYRPGILLNGDIDLRKEALLTKYVDHFLDESNLIGFYGIPHHGSHENMSRAMTEFSIKKAFIQSGYLNIHGHPSQTIINMHKLQNIKIKIINEKSDRIYLEE